MNFILRSIIVILVNMPLAVYADFYKCSLPDGKLEFRDKPCEAGGVEEKLQIKSIRTDVARKAEVLPPSTVEQSSSVASSDIVQETTNGANSGASEGVGSDVVNFYSEKQMALKGELPAAIYLSSYVVAWIVFSILLGWWAKIKNRSFWNWFVLGVLFCPGVMGLILLFRGNGRAVSSFNV